MPDPQAAPINPFVYTDTPTGYATPEQVAQMRALSQYNMQGMPEAKSWAGVLAHALGGFTGNAQMNQANQMQQQGLARGVADRASIGQQGQGGGLLGSQPSAGGNDPVSALAPAIAQRETGGTANPYGVVGRKSPNGDQPYGKYGVMGANVPKWTQEVLGQALTPQQFLANPQAQEAVFHGKMGQYYQQTGNPQDSASMWFGGKPLAQALAGGNKPDVLGTTPSAYVASVVSALHGGAQPQTAQASPTTNMNSRQYANLMGNPWIPQAEKDRYQEAQTPQTRVGATGQIIPFTPGQTPPGQELAPGFVPGPFAVPGFSGTSGAVTRNGVPQNPTAIVPPINGQGGSPTGNVAGWAGVGRGLQGELDTQGQNIGTLQGYVNSGGESHRMLGAISNLEEAGKHVGQQGWQKYIPPQLLALAQGYGIPADPDGSITGFKVAAMQALGTGPEWQGIREQIPNLNNTPEARMAIVEQIRSMHQYIAQRGDRSRGLGPDGKPDPALNTGGPDVYQKRLDAAQQTQMQTPGGGSPAPPTAPVNPKQGTTQQVTAPTAPVVRKWKRQADGSMGLSE